MSFTVSGTVNYIYLRDRATYYLIFVLLD